MKNITVEKEGKIGIVTVNRPKELNSMNSETRRELATAFEELDLDEEVNVSILTGSPGKAFIAGADIKEFSKNDETNKEDVTEKVKGKSMKNALITITIADISMSLDNVIAVTAIARDQTYLLMFGIGFSILLIAIFASAIVRLLTKFKWLSYVGLVFLIYLSTEMAIDGYFQIKPYISF